MSTGTTADQHWLVGTFNHRRAAAMAFVAAGVTLVGAGVFSSWNVTNSVTSGNLTAASGAATLLDANGGTFTTGVANLLPSDYFYRYIDVRNDGTIPNSFTGTVDVTGDLAGQLAIDASTCSIPWTTVATVSTCLGTTTAIGSGTPVSPATLTVNHGSIAVGAAAAQHVRYKFTFASSAPATLQGKSGGITIGVSSTMVGGSDRTTG